ncbi:putative RING-H2 finger protein ATL21A [Ricinus communis]|uniref:RING-type E3 ubiquitin transferase n=1 Tax=Ricinus communis TaxID=3988 RepID=B9SZQ0_RICCO|nr:putative RING-H2 finger protein ATL21A [Ricinus communis]EEF30919.1 conserved hypothetical protein [Ricinus communis]|eukprot:XP_002531469.1 putative RING-H2 finger protein ATL21A [Ricinus communis]
MDSAIFLFLSTMFLSIKGLEANCQTLKCADAAPDILFPFQESSQQQPHCGLPGFELSCRVNTTMIHFPNYGKLVVKSISYDIRKLDLLDPKNCVHEVFLNLNLSVTPFQYYYTVKNYTYLNCSTQLSSSFAEIPCLSGFKHHVYTVESSLPVIPVSCIPIKTVAIPFSFSPYLADNSFGLGLTWSLPQYEDSEIPDSSIKNSIIGDVSAEFLKVLLCILAVAMLVIIKMYQAKTLDVQIENENLNEVLTYCKTQENRQSSRSMQSAEERRV